MMLKNFIMNFFLLKFRFSGARDGKNSIMKSRSSHSFAQDNDDDDDDDMSPSSYLPSRYGQNITNDLSRSRSTHHLKMKENSPDRLTSGREKDGAALSSWARYLKVRILNFFIPDFIID